MELLYARCAGLDVHAKTVVACARIASGGAVTYHHRTVVTTTQGLLELAEWLTAQGCTHVVLESTGVYWKPIWHMLEDQFELTLANAMHVRNVPGRKSDMKDARWLADLLAMGLIRSSFVPPAPIQELRDLTRTRKQLVREIARHTQRIQKTLEDANVKLTEAISDILGTSGRAILKALMTGETDPERLVDLTTGRLKASRAQLVEVLRGRVTAHHRFMITLHLTQIEALETAVTTLEARIGDGLAPFRAAVNLLTTMPGLSETAAAVTLAEIGDNVSPFPTAGHLVSWAGLCPRAWMKAPASGAPPARGKEPRGSRPRSSKPPGPPRVEKTATSTRSFCASRAAGAPRRRSSPWRRRCSPTSITCFATAWNFMT
jgi:transposase